MAKFLPVQPKLVHLLALSLANGLVAWLTATLTHLAAGARPAQ